MVMIDKSLSSLFLHGPTPQNMNKKYEKQQKYCENNSKIIKSIFQCTEHEKHLKLKTQNYKIS
jgi:hypothetical protein